MSQLNQKIISDDLKATGGALTPPNPFLVGWQGLCPKCGEGSLYKSYLKPADKCNHCGLDFSGADAGDGAVPFVMMITGFAGIMVGVLSMFIMGYDMVWTIISACSVAIGLTLYLLPKVKSILIAFQYRYKAGDSTSKRFKDSD